MKKIFHFLITKFEKIKYLVILILTFVIIYGGIPGASSTLAIGAGLANCNPVLIGASISAGGAIASCLSQYTGQAILNNQNNPKTSKLVTGLEKIVQKNENLVIPILALSSISLIPETYLFASIGKDIPKIKMLIINLISRFLNFWLMSWLGKNYLKTFLKLLIQKVFKK